MFSVRSIFIALVLGLAALTPFAQTVPATINYQGRLTDNSPQQNPLSGVYPVRFDIYDAQQPAGTSQWNETDSVTVTAGIFNVQLGAGTAFPAALFSGGAVRYLQLTLNPGATQEVLTPRQQIGEVGYANQAQNAALATNATSATTATNSTQLGGVAASLYQLATVQNCGSGQFVNVIGNGSASCGSAQSSLTAPLSLSDNLGSPGAVISATNTGTGRGVSATCDAGVALFGSSASNLAGLFSGKVWVSSGNVGLGNFPSAYKLDVAGAVATTQGVKIPIYFNKFSTTPVCDGTWQSIGSYSVAPAVASYADIQFTGAVRVQSAGSSSLSIGSALYVDGVEDFNYYTVNCQIGIATGNNLSSLTCPDSINTYTPLAAGSHLIDVRVRCFAPLTASTYGTLKVTLYPQ